MTKGPHTLVADGYDKVKFWYLKVNSAPVRGLRNIIVTECGYVVNTITGLPYSLGMTASCRVSGIQHTRIEKIIWTAFKGEIPLGFVVRVIDESKPVGLNNIRLGISSKITKLHGFDNLYRRGDDFFWVEGMTSRRAVIVHVNKAKFFVYREEGRNADLLRSVKKTLVNTYLPGEDPKNYRLEGYDLIDGETGYIVNISKRTRLSDEKYTAVIEMRKQGVSVKDICKVLYLGKHTVYAILTTHLGDNDGKSTNDASRD